MVQAPAGRGGGHTGQEVVADEHAEEDKVVDDALHVEREGRRHRLELQLQVVPHQPEQAQGSPLLRACRCCKGAATAWNSSSR